MKSSNTSGGYEDGSGNIGERPEMEGDPLWDVRQAPQLFSEGEQIFAMILRNGECLGVLTLPNKADFEWLRSRLTNSTENDL